MNNRAINSFLLIILLCTLGFFINNAKIQNDDFFKIHNNIQQITMLNKDFNLYIKDSFQYNNFDIIQKKLNSAKEALYTLKNYKIFQEQRDTKVQNALHLLDLSLSEKITLMEKAKSYKAILNNSYLIIQIILKKQVTKDLYSVYTLVMTADKNPDLDIQKEIDYIDTLLAKKNSKITKSFLKHAKIILEYQYKIETLQNKIVKLNLEQKIDDFSQEYNNYSQHIIQKAYLAIIMLFLLLLLSLFLYLVYDYKLSLSRKELKRFRETVENSDNIIVITDEKQRIKYVNTAFTKVTGYTLEDVIGENPRILSSGDQPKEFYENINKTLYAGKKWSGTFINRGKSNNLSYEQATITPVYDDNNQIIEFIAIKLDITNEIIAKEQLYKKEKLLLQQSKMAAMGEMIQNIAHQWRQPLSLIATASTGLAVKKEMNIPITIEEEIETLNNINNTTQYLSETIDSFRDFFHQHKEKVHFSIKNVYKKTLNILDAKFQNSNIEIIESLEDISITNLDNELMQVIMNILNNAKDALEKNQRKLIFVTLYKNNNDVIMTIRDNGGGVDDKIIDKIFEPYFTTKHKSQGTGIGLYMCQEIITKHMQGDLTVQNRTYKYEDTEYTGAEFTLTFPNGGNI
ncbi:MAG: hypothetical protein CSA86_04440 [Arcobacter sp.]|nr:MAG: hypothetical protein CSA86_04440 [Arcobacter sp.]